MKEKIEIRELNEADFESISNLSLQLGYKIDSNLIKGQIKSIVNGQGHLSYIAILNNSVVGYIHGFRSIRLTTVPFFEIGGLIVKESARRKGIGKFLVQHLENQISGYETIRVRCNMKRKSAHSFYTNLDYSENKEQKVFQKKL